MVTCIPFVIFLLLYFVFSKTAVCFQSNGFTLINFSDFIVAITDEALVFMYTWVIDYRSKNWVSFFVLLPVSILIL